MVFSYASHRPATSCNRVITHIMLLLDDRTVTHYDQLLAS